MVSFVSGFRSNAISKNFIQAYDSKNSLFFDDNNMGNPESDRFANHSHISGTGAVLQAIRVIVNKQTEKIRKSSAYKWYRQFSIERRPIINKPKN